MSEITNVSVYLLGLGIRTAGQWELRRDLKVEGLRIFIVMTASSSEFDPGR